MVKWSATAGCLGLCQLRFCVSLRMEIPQPLWAESVPVFNHVPGKKSFFPVFKWYFLYFSLCLLLLALSFGTAEKNLAPFTLVLPSGIYSMDNIPESSLWARQNGSSSPSLSSSDRCSKSLIFFAVLHWTCCNAHLSAFYWGAWHWTHI